MFFWVERSGFCQGLDSGGVGPHGGFSLYFWRVFLTADLTPQKTPRTPPPWGRWEAAPGRVGWDSGETPVLKKYLVGWTLLGRKICSGGSTGKFTKFEVNKSSFPEVCPLWNPTLNLEAWINKHTYLVKAQIYPRHDIFTDIQRDRKICAWGMLSHLDTC